MKSRFNANRKKIRGWKRRIKQLNAWGERINQPYLKSFNAIGDYTYDRCIIYPFYTLEKRQPPLWFYKLIVAKFIAAYFEWNKIFIEMGISYDLQIWLYDPSYMWSEIICYLVEKPGEKKRYAWENESQKPFPYNKFSTNYQDIEQFEWILNDEELVIFESELEDEALRADDLFGEGYIIKASRENGPYYTKRIGDLWVGRLKQKRA